MKKKADEKEVVIHGYKGFDCDMKCRGFQFEEGKEYTHDGSLKICESGFHFCESPMDVLNYYNVCDSTFAEVEGSGKVVGHADDSKKAVTQIKIGAKLSLPGFIKASIDFLLKPTKPASGDSSKLAASGDSSKLAASGHSSQLAASGDSSKLAASGDSSQLAASGRCSQLAASGHCSQLAASGDSSQLAASGHSSQLAASGDSSKLEMTGDDSVGAAIGIKNKIKGKVGDWITLSEWEYDTKKSRHIPVYVKTVKIDGKEIKADTWYILKYGKFIEE
jgi:hypothetical protein